MSLKNFHLVFIVAASALCFVFGAWALRAADGGGMLATAIVSFLAGAGLIAYGVWFRRKVRTRDEEDARRRKMFRSMPALLLLPLLSVRDALACNVCYGEASGPMIDAARSRDAGGGSAPPPRICFTSSPAQKAFPFPVRIRTRASVCRTQSSRSM